MDTELSLLSPVGKPPSPMDEEESGGFTLFGEDGLTFRDLLDVVNPLHHIPIVGTFYRNLTGDEIAPAPRVLGGTLYGGPIGAGFALLNAVIEHNTGSDLTEHVVALFDGDDEPANGETMAAEAPAADSPGHPLNHFAAVSDWAQRETTFRRELAEAATRGRPASSHETDTRTAPVLASGRGSPSLFDGSSREASPVATALLAPREAATVNAQLLAQARAGSPTPKPSRRPAPQLTGEAAEQLRYETELDARLTALAASTAHRGAPRVLAAPPMAAPMPDQVTTPLAGAAPAPSGWFGQAMLAGLEKYERGRAVQ